jgi:hypothetical protein
MNIALRFFCLLGGIAGLALLIYYFIDAFPNINPIYVLVITVPDMLLFFLAYRTYPAETRVKRYR